MKMAARFSVVAFHVAPFGADQIAGPRSESSEGNPVFLVRLLHAGGLQVFQDHLGEGLLRAVFGAVFLEAVDQFIVLIDAEHAVRARLSTVKGPATRTFFLSS